MGLAVVYLFPDLHGGPLRASAPFGALAKDIRDLGFEDGYVLAENHYIAGNLRLHMPEVTVAEPEYGLWPVAHGKAAPVLLAWSGRRDRPPKALRTLFTELCGPDAFGDPEATRLTGPLRACDKTELRVEGRADSGMPGRRPVKRRPFAAHKIPVNYWQKGRNRRPEVLYIEHDSWPFWRRIAAAIHDAERTPRASVPRP